MANLPERSRVPQGLISPAKRHFYSGSNPLSSTESPGNRRFFVVSWILVSAWMDFRMSPPPSRSS
jgi:hypothetical protein